VERGGAAQEKRIKMKNKKREVLLVGNLPLMNISGNFLMADRDKEG